MIAPDGVFADGDWIESKDQDPRGQIRLLQLADVGDGVFVDKSNRFINEKTFEKLRCTEVIPFDVLIARMPDPLGRACIAPGSRQKRITVVDVAIVRPGPGSVTPTWLMHTINAPEVRGVIGLESSGTTRRRIARGKLASLSLPVPPLNEQHRITEKIDSLIAKVKSCRERLDRVPGTLKKLRESVLEAAVSGTLTEEWRGENSSLGTGALVLRAIADERRRLGLKSADRTIDDEGIEMPDLLIPKSWVWCRVGQIADVRLGGTPSRGINSYWGGHVPWVSSGEVSNGRITRTRETISMNGVSNSNAKIYPPGSVLIAMIGEGKTRGQSAILDIPASTNQNVASLVFDGGEINGEYVWLWALGQYEKTRSIGRGGNQPALNGAKVRALPIPIPSRLEQNEIVRRVTDLFAYLDSLQGRCDDVSRRVEKLAPSVLAKAFRGELVPQDPNDEPAREMLERIRVKKVTNGGKRKSRGMVIGGSGA
jgi:type I restriction enzyme S subunit